MLARDAVEADICRWEEANVVAFLKALHIGAHFNYLARSLMSHSGWPFGVYHLVIGLEYHDVRVTERGAVNFNEYLILVWFWNRHIIYLNFQALGVYPNPCEFGDASN